jgi:hypothetical protein
VERVNESREAGYREPKEERVKKCRDLKKQVIAGWMLTSEKGSKVKVMQSHYRH